MEGNPKKKHRSVPSTDFNKCIICQTVTSNPLVKTASEDTIGNILQYLASRAKCGETGLLEPSTRLEHMTKEELISRGATYHASCRKNVVSSQKLERAQARIKQAVNTKSVSVLSRASGRPSDQFQLIHDEPGPSQPRLSRAYTAKYDKQLCFFCQTETKEEVHAIQSRNRGTQLHNYVDKCTSDLYKVYLSSAIQPEDAISVDIKYHTTCWTKHVVRGTITSTTVKEQNVNEAEIAANVEFLHLINSLLRKGKIVAMDDAHETYLSILRLHGCGISHSRKYVRQMIIDNVANVDFIRAFQRNEADRFCLNAATIAAINAAVTSSHIV